MVEGWNKVKLSEISKDIVTGTTPSTAIKDYYYGDYLFASPSDINDNKYIYETIKTLTEKGFNQVRKLPQGTILVTCIGELGKTSIATKEMCSNEQINSIICKDNISNEFIYYQMLQNKNQLNLVAGLQVVPLVNKSEFSEIKILVPIEKKEQKKIADILSSVDSAIESTSKIISKQKRIKTALMQDLLTNGIDENGKIRSEQTHQYKDSPLGKIPVEWDISLSSEYCDSIADGTHDTPKPTKEGYPLYTSKNLVAGKLDKADFYNISIQDMEQINKRSFVEQYDILFGMIGTIGNPVIVNEYDYNFSVKNVAIFRFSGLLVKSQWLYYYLSSEAFENYIQNIFSGSTQKFISLSNLREFVIKYPKSETEQQKIAQILSKQDEAIEQEEKKLAKLQRIKTALMQDLLSAKVRVKYE